MELVIEATVRVTIDDSLYRANPSPSSATGRGGRFPGNAHLPLYHVRHQRTQPQKLNICTAWERDANGNDV